MSRFSHQEVDVWAHPPIPLVCDSLYFAQRSGRQLKRNRAARVLLNALAQVQLAICLHPLGTRTHTHIAHPPKKDPHRLRGRTLYHRRESLAVRAKSKPADGYRQSAYDRNGSRSSSCKGRTSTGHILGGSMPTEVAPPRQLRLRHLQPWRKRRRNDKTPSAVRNRLEPSLTSL